MANGGQPTRNDADDTDTGAGVARSRRRRERGTTEMMHAYMIKEIADYNQAEIARSRGYRVWGGIFKNKSTSRRSS